MKKQELGFLSLFLLVLSTFACKVNVGGPEYPNDRIPVSTQSVAQLKSGIQTAVSQVSDSGEIKIIITEQQLTSYFYYMLQSQPDPFIVDPQVYLRENKIQIFGTAHKGYLEASVSITFLARIDEQNQIQLEISSADFGPFPIPDGLKEAVSEVITEAYTGSLGPIATGFRVENIVIADGAILIIGRIK